jgi:uncharacterized protein YndB with AHSA1/START domain
MDSAAKTPVLELVIERTLKAAPDKVWRCWTEAELLNQWFCPKPWRAEIHSIDLRPGGGQSMTMFGPAGEQHTFGGVYLEVTKNKRLVTTNAFAEGWIPQDHPHPGFPEVTFIELADAPGGGTKYRAGARHWSEEAMKQHEAMGFYEGWGICTDQLDALALTLK